LARFVERPTEALWQGVQRVFRYLQGTVDKGIFFPRAADSRIMGYCDASYGGDMGDARSTSGYVFTIGGPILWSSRRQQLTSLSSTEAEFVALTEASKQAIWLKAVYSELCTKYGGKAIRIHCDNKPAVMIANNAKSAARSKAMLVRNHFVVEAVESGEIEVVHIPGTEMVADVFTKPLGGVLFNRHMDKLMV
jgi:hypothetical protein